MTSTSRSAKTNLTPRVPPIPSNSGSKPASPASPPGTSVQSSSSRLRATKSAPRLDPTKRLDLLELDSLSRNVPARLLTPPKSPVTTPIPRTASHARLSTPSTSGGRSPLTNSPPVQFRSRDVQILTVHQPSSADEKDSGDEAVHYPPPSIAAAAAHLRDNAAPAARVLDPEPDSVLSGGNSLLLDHLQLGALSRREIYALERWLMQQEQMLEENAPTPKNVIEWCASARAAYRMAEMQFLALFVGDAPRVRLLTRMFNCQERMVEKLADAVRQRRAAFVAKASDQVAAANARVQAAEAKQQAAEQHAKEMAAELARAEAKCEQLDEELEIYRKFVFIKTGRMKSLLDPEEDPPQPAEFSSTQKSQPDKPKLPKLQTLLEASNSNVGQDKVTNLWEEQSRADLENFVESAFTRDQMLAELEQITKRSGVLTGLAKSFNILRSQEDSVLSAVSNTLEGDISASADGLQRLLENVVAEKKRELEARREASTQTDPPPPKKKKKPTGPSDSLLAHTQNFHARVLETHHLPTDKSPRQHLGNSGEHSARMQLSPLGLPGARAASARPGRSRSPSIASRSGHLSARSGAGSARPHRRPSTAAAAASASSSSIPQSVSSPLLQMRPLPDLLEVAPASATVSTSNSADSIASAPAAVASSTGELLQVPTFEVAG